MSSVIQIRDYESKAKMPYRRIAEGQTLEQFLASLNPGEVYEHPETLRLMVKSAGTDQRAWWD